MGLPGGTGGSPWRLGGRQVSSMAVFAVESLGIVGVQGARRCFGEDPTSPDFMEGEIHCRYSPHDWDLFGSRKLPLTADWNCVGKFAPIT